MCDFPYSVLSAESSREKERGEFSMVSTVDVCAACSAVSMCVQSEPLVDFLLTFSHCLIPYIYK